MGAGPNLTEDEWDVVECNAGLVRRIAYRIMAAAGIQGQEQDDIMSAGRIGLAKAVARCDAEKGGLVAIADFWIREEIHRHRLASRLIAIPYYLTHRTAHRNSPFARRARTALAVDMGEDFDLGMFADEREHGEASCVSGEVARRVAEALGRLPDRQRAIVEARMHGESLREIGDRMGRTRERVRQLEVEAHKKLRVMLADYA